MGNTDIASRRVFRSEAARLFKLHFCVVQRQQRPRLVASTEDESVDVIGQLPHGYKQNSVLCPGMGLQARVELFPDWFQGGGVHAVILSVCPASNSCAQPLIVTDPEWG